MAVFWVVALCSLVEVYSTTLHGVTTQKTAIFLKGIVTDEFEYYVKRKYYSYRSPVVMKPRLWWTAYVPWVGRQEICTKYWWGNFSELLGRPRRK
jgi:hypothetical protein